MKILLLGGTGAIGKTIIDFLVQNKHIVHVTTRKERSSTNSYLTYIKGDAHDLDFLESLLNDAYDVIVDFMVYKTEEFKNRYYKILENTKQYVFISSSRVYAASKEPINEETYRLLDVSKDKRYLRTDEYALAKARQEDILLTSKYDNWIIIRPYITFDIERLQLGVFEKELWLQRALNGKTIVFSKDIAQRKTTMTYSCDVSRHIAKIIGRKESNGQVYQVTNGVALKWEDILECYLNVLEENMGVRPKVYMVETFTDFPSKAINKYQLMYDRLYDRVFNSNKIETDTNDVQYADTLETLKECLGAYIKGKKTFLYCNWWLEGYCDKLTGERTRISDIHNLINKVQYFLARYIL